MDDRDREQARRLWRRNACAPEAFRADGCLVVAADEHQCSPRGWVGVVELGGSTVVVAPSAIAPQLAERIVDLPIEERLATAAIATRVLGPARSALGPAILYYGSMATPPRRDDQRVLGPLAFTDPLVQQVTSDSKTDELAESSLNSATSGLFVSLDRAGHPGAASGWCEWPESVAQLGVLTATSKRRQGLGLIAAEAAILSATRAGLLPQWRSVEVNHASRALAEQLGLVAFGRQYSFLPAE